MSFIYSLQAFWNNNSQVFNGIDINVSNGLGGNPVYASGSKFLNLLKNSVSVYSVDPNGNQILAGDTTGVNATFSGTMNAGVISQGGVPIKKVITNQTYWFAPAPLGNDSNNGTSALTPKLTFQTWWNTLKASYIVVGNLTFQFLAGTYDQSLQMFGNIDGVSGPGNFRIYGTLDDNTAVVIRPSVTTNARYCISGSGDCQCTIRGMTLDGSLSGAINGSDKLAVGGATITVGNIKFIGYSAPTGANDITLLQNATFQIDGDLTITGGHRQTMIDSADHSSAYLNTNGVQSTTRTGNFTSGSNTVTLTVALTSSYGVGNLVRGTGIPQDARIKTIDATLTIITLMNANGDSITTTGGGPQTLTIGGLFWNFVAGPTMDVACFFGALNPATNIGGIEVTGNFIGQDIIISQGARLDLGTSALTVLPGTIPAYVDGGTGASLKNDTGGTRLIIPKSTGAGISGQSATGIIEFQTWTAGPALAASSDGILQTKGATSGVLFQDETPTQYFKATPVGVFLKAGAKLDWNAGAITQTYTSATQMSWNIPAAGGLYSFQSTTDCSFRIYNGTVDARLIASSGGVGQFGTVSNHSVQVLTNAAVAARFWPSTGLSVGVQNDPGAGMIYTNSASFMIRTKTSYADGAGVATGTLTNAPAATNPTKWIPIDDNGTTRYIPAW